MTEENKKDRPQMDVDMGAGRKMRVPIDLPSNKKPTEKNPGREKKEKVVTGKVITKKKGLMRKIAETFTGDDVHSVGGYILFDVVVPASKNLIQDIVNEGIQRLLFGDVRGRVRPTQRGNYTSYNKIYDTDRRPRDISHRARATHDFDEIVIDNRSEADSVIDGLATLIDDFGVATVSDLYDLVGMTGSFTDNKWGWFNLREASVIRIREGYLLNLPRPVPID